MRFKNLLPFVLLFSGILIALFSAFMTYLIIDEPIGMTMFTKIIMMVLFLLPIVGYAVYMINKKLQKESDELSLMIGSFAHDFKTPLTIIDGYLEEIEDGMISKEKLPETIAKLKGETKFLNELTVGILHFTKSSQVNIKQETILLKSFLDEEVLPHLDVDKQLEIKFEIPIDVVVKFDKMDLKKVLLNLLQNSIKFTHEGYIMISTKGKTIMIEDSGIGIDERYHDKIFQPYFTIEESKNREKSGFGLGLATVRYLCEKNGYKIKVDSRFEGGTRIVLY